MKNENQTISTKADRAAFAMGCEDKVINNMRPDYTGEVIINGQRALVSCSCVFNGILHYGIYGYTGKDFRGDNFPRSEAFCGWIPAFLCKVP